MRCVVLLVGLWATAALADGPVLSIAGTEARGQDYGGVLEALHDVGAEATSLTLYWDELEQSGVYGLDPDWPAIANAVYPAQGLAITLNIAVIDTVADRRPADLKGLSWSDPQVIARFETVVSSVLAAMAQTELTSIGIGNEVDGFLSSSDWADYAVFFAAARDATKQLRPDVPVGVTFTWAGLSDSVQARDLADLGDVWMVNYYPLDPAFQVTDPTQARDTLAAMVAAASTPVFLTETGYPSGGCHASAAGQEVFLRNVIGFAEDHAADMPLVTLFWLHDIEPDLVDSYAAYYGVDDGCFTDYLATLGLRFHDGRDKPAFAWLRERAK